MQLNEKGTDFIQDILEANEGFLNVSNEVFIAQAKHDISKDAPELLNCKELDKIIMEFIENE